MVTQFFPITNRLMSPMPDDTDGPAQDGDTIDAKGSDGAPIERLPSQVERLTRSSSEGSKPPSPSKQNAETEYFCMAQQDEDDGCYDVAMSPRPSPPTSATSTPQATRGRLSLGRLGREGGGPSSVFAHAALVLLGFGLATFGSQTSWPFSSLTPRAPEAEASGASSLGGISKELERLRQEVSQLKADKSSGPAGAPAAGGSGNPACWMQGYTYSLCCHEKFGKKGNPACWDSKHTYKRCCIAPAATHK
eukprot:TRINITY_DN14863_c0_g1_i1.p1 TRINITY_DN14863_c0_g1~~TRINITY_DN14863_c0_g1_i1.p1  ORF type:complete len:249 (-),score=48.33 TRINITY_DN14863_c0_g1_i1:544-1290(-)